MRDDAGHQGCRPSGKPTRSKVTKGAEKLMQYLFEGYP